MPLKAHFLWTADDYSQTTAAGRGRHDDSGSDQRNEGNAGLREPLTDGRRTLVHRRARSCRHAGEADLRLYCCSKAAGRQISDRSD